MESLTIGSCSRDGLLEIADTNWDSNGTLKVTVRALFKGSDMVDGLPLERMRRLARRALMYPDKTRSSRVINRFIYNGCEYVTFAVSRLEA